MDPEKSDSEERTYDETLEYILLRPFPTLEKHGFRHNHSPTESRSVLQLPDARNVYGDMIQCDECEEWSLNPS